MLKKKNNLKRCIWRKWKVKSSIYWSQDNLTMKKMKNGAPTKNVTDMQENSKCAQINTLQI